jgi:hypothetical protein
MRSFGGTGRLRKLATQLIQRRIVLRLQRRPVG